MPVLNFIEFEPNNNGAQQRGLTIIRLDVWETQVDESPNNLNRLTEKTHEKFALEIITFCHHGWVPDAADAVGGGFGFSDGQCR